jgi:phage shock protein E
MKHWSSLVVLGAALACAPSADNTDVSAQELLAAGADEFVVLDVRSASEFGSGHVPGARNIPHDELADRLAELDDVEGRAVVVYCERGGRAGQAASTLASAGFGDVRHLAGDMSGWRAAELPVESP